MSARSTGNLPAELTSFVGRRTELIQIKGLLASARLVTLTGMGGIGKTRLARRLAGEVRRTFPDGVWLVELADLHQGTLLPQAIGAALGVRDESSDPVGTLIDHLRSRRCLLVLDNCEHLTEPCAALIGQILQAAPWVKIVATSRHVLGVQGEQIFPVDSLTHEAADDHPSEAMELFEERASAADPNFRINTGNRATVVAICQRLEGLPLAVELAAANVRTFAPDEILDRLQDPALLTASEQTRPSRHHTLRAAVEWSYQLCTRQEQRTWEQLSVFAGGFTVDAAQAVCTMVDDGSTITTALKGLVDKSVLRRVDDAGESRARYRMLEPVRQFAAEKLAAAPDAEEVRRRHRDHFLALARRSVQDYCSPRDVEWYATTRREHPNIRQALAFSLSDRKEPERAIEMATVLRPFWEQAGTVLEGSNWLRRALEHAPEPTPERGHGLASASILGFLLGDDEAGRRYRAEQLELAEQLGWDEPPSAALFASALEAYADGDVKRAFVESERAVQQGLRHEDSGATAEAMALSALYAFILQSDEAEEIAARFVSYAESRGAHLLKAIALYPLGAVRWLKGDVSAARKLMREAIRLYQLFDHPGMVAVCVEGLGWSAARTEPDLAAKLLGAARSIWKYSQMLLAEKAVQRVGQEIESRLRQELGDMAFEQQYAAGQELSYTDAINLALGETTKQSDRKRKSPSPDAGLTRREQEVAALVAAGLTSKEIAAKLVISHRTADAHIEHIRAKLGVRSRAQIARWFSEYADAHRADQSHHEVAK